MDLDKARKHIDDAIKELGNPPVGHLQDAARNLGLAKNRISAHEAEGKRKKGSKEIATK